MLSIFRSEALFGHPVVMALQSCHINMFLHYSHVDWHCWSACRTTSVDGVLTCLVRLFFLLIDVSSQLTFCQFHQRMSIDKLQSGHNVDWHWQYTQSFSMYFCVKFTDLCEYLCSMHNSSKFENNSATRHLKISVRLHHVSQSIAPSIFKLGKFCL